MYENKIRITGNFFWEVLEGIIGKFLSILGPSCVRYH